ncbi:LCP family protein [Lentibacillus salinarum]|uniref:LCP family protein n=1 Tax=Lentibacillus salinarum TaxID=446820 RepID=A0ABW3ZWS7_9BACI
MNKLRSAHRKHKKDKRWKKWTLNILLLLIVIVIGLGIYLFNQIYNAAQGSYKGLDRPSNKSELREQTVDISDEPISILLIGTESYSSNGKNGRADTLIVVTLDPKDKELTMTSIPRDTRVEFTVKEAGKYAGFHKINAAYTYGSISGYGANKLTVETVEDLLDIPIDEYITVNFEAFRDIVNALGGVTVDIKKGFWEKNIFNNDKRIYFEEGLERLNGEEALAFVRMRKRDIAVEYTRMERQRQFIKAAIDQAISAGTIFKVGEISDIISKNVKTSLKPSEIFALQQTYSSMDPTSIETFDIKGSNEMIDGLSYFIPTEEGLNRVARQLKQILKLDSYSTESNG